MQGVQGILKSGRTRLAAYENYVLDRCPECRADLVRTNEEDGGERAFSRCGIVTGRTNAAHRDGSSSAPSVDKSEPLGSYIIADSSGSGQSLNGHALGWARLMPYIVDRATPLLKCSRLTGRIAEKLALPKSIVQSAEIPARRLIPHREAYGTTIPSISAYSLLYACSPQG
jgi:hypothetical protein